MKIFNFNYRIKLIKKSKSLDEIQKEIDDLKEPVLKGFAFIQPLIGHSYSFKLGKPVIVNGNIGEIKAYIKEESVIDVYLHKLHYVKRVSVMQADIIVVLTKQNYAIPLSPHDWNHLINSFKDKRSVYIEYKHTKHGNVKLTESFKKTLK
jgi:hypothetical protein